MGGGIVALPVETGAIGFWSSLFYLAVCWIFMMSTGLLYAEASLWMDEEDAHVVTMSKHLLGRFGEWVSILLYLFMGYASLIAYNAGGSSLVVAFISFVTGVQVSGWLACIIFAVVFGGVLYLGARIIGMINAIFVVGLLIAYIGLIALGIPEVKLDLIERINWTSSFTVLPLVLTTFSYQMVVPSMTLYLKHDAKALKFAVVVGTTLPFIGYALWQFVVLGIVPNSGVHGLAEAYRLGKAATDSLIYFVQSPILRQLSQFFAFFAIVTSYFGIGLGLYDFLSDLTKIKKKGWGRFILGLLVILPTLYFTVIYPNAFLFALEVTGGLGDSILNGVIPILMVWIGRYVVGNKSDFKSPVGSRPILAILCCFAFYVLGVQIYNFFCSSLESIIVRA